MAKVYGRLALIALLIFAGVRLWYGQFEKQLQGKSPAVQEQAAPPAEQPPAAPEPAGKADYQIILTRNIFKAALEAGAQPSGAASQPDMEDLAETKMQLVLLGTVVGSKEDARAIIRNEKTKLEDIYHVGSDLYGATITRIARGKVVLQVNGREEVLNIKEPEGGVPRPSAAAVLSQPEMQPAGANERPTPVVVPQRRISFRNPTVAPSEPPTPEPAAPAPAESGGAQQGEEQQPAPNEEPQKDGNAVQQAQ